MALFALILVGIVVVQTWLDWRDEKKSWIAPDWAKGIALGGVVAVSLAAATSTASVWLREGAGQWTSTFIPGTFWPEFAFLFCAMAIILFAVRRKRLRLMLLLGVVVVTAFWLGMAL